MLHILCIGSRGQGFDLKKRPWACCPDSGSYGVRKHTERKDPFIDILIRQLYLEYVSVSSKEKLVSGFKFHRYLSLRVRLILNEDSCNDLASNRKESATRTNHDPVH